MIIPLTLTGDEKRAVERFDHAMGDIGGNGVADILDRCDGQWETDKEQTFDLGRTCAEALWMIGEESNWEWLCIFPASLITKMEELFEKARERAAAPLTPTTEWMKRGQ